MAKIKFESNLHELERILEQALNDIKNLKNTLELIHNFDLIMNVSRSKTTTVVEEKETAPEVPAQEQPSKFDTIKFIELIKKNKPEYLRNFDMSEGSTTGDLLKLITYSIQQALKEH